MFPAAVELRIIWQISFFIIVSTSSLYAEQLGGNATFSGLVIGIPTVFAGLALIPLMKYDKGRFTIVITPYESGELTGISKADTLFHST
jgi:hypothetical protein